MRKGLTKLVVGIFPFLVFVASVLLLTVLIPKPQTGLDRQWATRLFVIGLIVFAGITIIPDLLQLHVFWTRNGPRLRIKLSHHTPSLRQSHEIRLRGTSVCMGCFGSFLGILVTEIVFLLYMGYPVLFISIGSFPLVGLGSLMVLFSYSRYLIFIHGYFRMIQHSTLFLGLGVLIVGSDLLLTSALALVLLLPSWISFLLARILLSRIEHHGTTVNIA